jgi:myo-inositol-1(or 4)-monophosphatase
MAEAAPSPEAAAWFALLREASGRISGTIRGMGPAERASNLGRGAGGDVTAGVDRVAEDEMLDALRAWHHRTGSGMTIVSEEMGVLELGGGGAPVIVIDPVDGSQNAKRGAPLFATAVAVADGPTMGGVRYAFVHDHSTGEEFTAERGAGAWLDGRPMSQTARPAHLRLLAVEGASASRMQAAAEPLVGEVARLRSLGSMALSMCWVAAGRMDGLLGLSPVRSVDVAAAQLVLRETGCWVGLPEREDVEDCPLDVTTRRRVMATAEPELLDRLRAALGAAVATG